MGKVRRPEPSEPARCRHVVGASVFGEDLYSVPMMPPGAAKAIQVACVCGCGGGGAQACVPDTSEFHQFREPTPISPAPRAPAGSVGKLSGSWASPTAGHLSLCLDPGALHLGSGPSQGPPWPQTISLRPFCPPGTLQLLSFPFPWCSNRAQGTRARRGLTSHLRSTCRATTKAALQHLQSSNYIPPAPVPTRPSWSG